jgi:hypothetical protein
MIRGLSAALARVGDVHHRPCLITEFITAEFGRAKHIEAGGMVKRTEITIETDQVLIIRRRRRVVRAWCAACAGKSEVVTADEAAVAAGVELQTVYGWARAGDVHFTETPEGLLLVCLNSLRPLLSGAGAGRVQGDAYVTPDRPDGGAEQSGSERISWPLASADFGDEVSGAVRHFALSTLRTCWRIISSLL